MKAVLIVLGLIIAAILLYCRAADRSFRRVGVINSVGKVLSWEQAFREHGVITNSARGYRMFSYTNSVMVGTNSFRCEFAVESDWTRDFGFMALATDGTILWIDREFAPCIARALGGSLSMPERFR